MKHNYHPHYTNYKDLIRLVKSSKYKVISFDIFNTVILRPCLNPTAIFRLVQKRCSIESDFAELREEAEKRVRAKTPPDIEDVTLDEIYLELADIGSISYKEMEEIKRTEKEIEKHYFMLNPSIKKVYDVALETGKQILFCSDMYLPRMFLEEAICDLNLTGFNRIYVSSEFRLCKISGGLYKAIIADLARKGISKKEILHIGDSYESDYIGARIAGIDAALIHLPVKNLYTCEEWEFLDNKSDNTFLLGFGLALLRNGLDENLGDTWRKIVFSSYISALTKQYKMPKTAKGIKAAMVKAEQFNYSYITTAEQRQACAELVALFFNDDDFLKECICISKAYSCTFSKDEELMEYNSDSLLYLLLRSAFSSSNATSLRFGKWSSKYESLKDTLNNHQVMQTEHLSLRHRVKSVFAGTALYPFLRGVYRVSNKIAQRSSLFSITRIKKTKEKMAVSIKDLHFLAQKLPQDTETVLVLGHMAAFDKGVCAFLNRLSKELNSVNLVLLSSTPLLSCAEIRAKIDFHFTIIPKVSSDGGYDSHLRIKPRKHTRELNVDKSIFQACTENMRAHFADMEEGYPEFLSQYFFDYCTSALNSLQPSAVLIWNEFVPLSRIMRSVCNEFAIPSAFLEFGSFYGTYALDIDGQMGESTVSRNSDEFRALEVNRDEMKRAAEVCDYLSKEYLNRNPQPASEKQIISLRKRLKQDRPNVVYFGQSDFESGLYPYSDNVREMHSPIYKSSIEPLADLAKLGEKNKWNIIYKPHPQMENHEKSQIIPVGVELITGVDIYELIALADVTITIFSQCSYESLIHGVPVVMLGYNQLRGKGCTYEAFKKDNLDSVIQQALLEGFTNQQREAFYRHAAQMLKYCLYDDGTKREMRYGKPMEDFISQLYKIIEIKETEQ